MSRLHFAGFTVRTSVAASNGRTDSITVPIAVRTQVRDLTAAKVRR